MRRLFADRLVIATGVIVILMAAFLWVSDKTLEYLLYDLILGWKR